MNESRRERKDDSERSSPMRAILSFDEFGAKDEFLSQCTEDAVGEHCRVCRCYLTKIEGVLRIGYFSPSWNKGFSLHCSMVSPFENHMCYS